MQNPDIPPEIKRIIKLSSTQKTVYSFECDVCKFRADTDEEVQYHYESTHPEHTVKPFKVNQITSPPIEEPAKVPSKPKSTNVTEPKTSTSTSSEIDSKIFAKT